VLNYEIDRGKVSFPDFFYGLKKLVKTPLIGSSCQFISPTEQFLLALIIFESQAALKFLKFEPIGLA
jgi:EamA domain-containing membrane protein RarD